MLSKQEDVEVGQIVWLRPQTKTASSFVHRRLRCMIIDKEAHWPIVIVEIRDRANAGTPQIRVHKNDIVLRPSRVRKPEGDGPGTEDILRIPKPLYKPPKPLVLPEGVEQGELW